MRQKNITYEDTVRAAQALADEGKKCSVQNIRDVLGRGSYTTISNHVSQWRGSQDPTSTPIQDKDLWADAFAQATQSFTVEKTAWEQQRQAVLSVLERLEEDKRQSEELIQSLRSQIEKQQADFLILVEKLKESRGPCCPCPKAIDSPSHSPSASVLCPSSE